VRAFAIRWALLAVPFVSPTMTRSSGSAYAGCMVTVPSGFVTRTGLAFAFVVVRLIVSNSLPRFGP
jgi:hypothetical protein